MCPVARVSGIVSLHGKPSWTLLKLCVTHDILWSIAKPTGPCKAHIRQAEDGYESNSSAASIMTMMSSMPCCAWFCVLGW